MPANDDPVFLLGAGFNADASAEVGSLPNISYPLLVDLERFVPRCSKERSIEEGFAEAISRRKHEPLKLLCDCLMEADYYLAEKLCSGSNAYLTFLHRFPTASFLSFNYDSLLEILLFSLKRWV